MFGLHTTKQDLNSLFPPYPRLGDWQEREEVRILEDGLRRLDSTVRCLPFCVVYFILHEYTPFQSSLALGPYTDITVKHPPNNRAKITKKRRRLTLNRIHIHRKRNVNRANNQTRSPTTIQTLSKKVTRQQWKRPGEVRWNPEKITNYWSHRLQMQL